jgi:O-antigen/teichoic acid export membrane protein
LVAAEQPPTAVPARSFSFNVALTLATRILMGVNSVLTGVIVARWLGAKDLGTLAVLNVTIAYAVQISSLGLASANTYFIAKDRHRLASAALNSFVFCCVTGVVGAGLVILLAKESPALLGDISLSIVGAAAVAVPFQLLTLIGLNIFLAEGRISRSNFLDFMNQSTLLLSAIVSLVILRRGLPELITMNSGAAIAVSLLVVLLVAGHVKRETPAGHLRADPSLLHPMLGYGIKVHLQTIVSLLLFRVDLLIVKYFRGSTQAGVYSVASQVAVLLMLLPAVISTLLFPRIAAAQDQSGALACKVTRHAAFVMLVICIAAVPSIFALPLLYGSEFSGVVEQALILLPGVFLVSIAGVLAQHFSGTGLPIALPLFWVVGLVCNTIANLVVVPKYGAVGAAITSSVSYALVFALISIYFCIRTGNTLREAYVIRTDELRALLNPRRLLLQ